MDFAVRKARVAMEIDGAVHDFPGRAEYDAARQARLESKGWRFVRIRSEAKHDPKAILDAVRVALPLPLRGGGGEASPFPREVQRRTRANRKYKPRRRT